MRSPIVVRFEGSGARLLCQATPYFEMIKVREVKCGDKKRVKLKKIIGVSKEDSDKLVGLTEVGLGTGLSKIGATISAEVGSQISVSECYEEEEETFYEVGKCDARTIEIHQRVIRVDVKWERKTFFGITRTGQLEFRVRVNEFRDLGQAVLNHRDCGCGTADWNYLSKLLRIKVTDSLTSFETVQSGPSGDEILSKFGSVWKRHAYENKSFDVPSERIPSEVRFFANLPKDKSASLFIERQIDPGAFKYEYGGRYLDPMPVLFPEIYDDIGFYPVENPPVKAENLDSIGPP